MKKLFIATLISAAFIQVFAHDGHGNESPLSPGHYAFNPEHSTALAIAIIAVAVFISVLIKKSRAIK